MAAKRCLSKKDKGRRRESAVRSMGALNSIIEVETMLCIVGKGQESDSPQPMAGAVWERATYLRLHMFFPHTDKRNYKSAAPALLATSLLSSLLSSRSSPSDTASQSSSSLLSVHLYFKIPGKL